MFDLETAQEIVAPIKKTGVKSVNAKNFDIQYKNDNGHFAFKISPMKFDELGLSSNGLTPLVDAAGNVALEVVPQENAIFIRASKGAKKTPVISGNANSAKDSKAKTFRNNLMKAGLADGNVAAFINLTKLEGSHEGNDVYAITITEIIPFSPKVKVKKIKEGVTQSSAPVSEPAEVESNDFE